MKITFVGASHGVPEPDRKCSCIMIETGENIYFIDMGASSVEALRKRGKDINKVKGVFITHMHGDHINGLVQMVDLITWYFKTPDPVIVLPDTRAKEIIDDWLDVTMNGKKQTLRYEKTAPGVVFDDGVLKMTAYPTQHCPNSFAYLAEAEGKRVLFTGDLKNPKIDFPKEVLDEKTDLIICESAHFPATDYEEVFENKEIESVCVTHYSDRFLRDVVTLIEKLREKGISARRANDDLEIAL